MRVELEEILFYFPQRKQDSHKGTYGKVLNIAGSKYYTGAAVLSSLSAVKTGAGYVTLACPDVISNSVCSYTPDLTLFPLKSFNKTSIHSGEADKVIKKSSEYDVISIGSGIYTNTGTEKFVMKFLEKNEKPAVIDADALNIVSMHQGIQFTQETIITPHPKELSRLINITTDLIQKNREEYAVKTSKQYNCITVLKGNHTVVTDGERIYINKTGNSGLAKAGSGDVLTGIISGIYAQTRDSFMSAAIGVYLHGLCGEAASKDLTEYSVLASDLISYIPKAIKSIITMEVT